MNRPDNSSYPPGLWRAPSQGMVAGVCAGIAQRFDVPVIAVRLGTLMATAIAFPVAVTGYFVMAAFLPRRTGPEISLATGGAPCPSRAALQERFLALECRLRGLEAHVVSREFRLKQAFRDMDAPRP